MKKSKKNNDFKKVITGLTVPALVLTSVGPASLIVASAASSQENIDHATSKVLELGSMGVTKEQVDETIVGFLKNFGGSKSDTLKDVKATPDGGFISVGYTSSPDIGLTPADLDAFIVKHDANGNEKWIKGFGGTKDDRFYSVTLTPDGGFIAVGTSNSTDAGFTLKGTLGDAIAVKYDGNGNQEWVTSIGGDGTITVSSVVPTQDGGFVLVGYTKATNLGFTSKGQDDGFAVKFDASGNQQWIKNIGGSSFDYIYTAIASKDGGIILGGLSNSTNAGFTHKGVNDAILVKLDVNGTQQWIKNFGGSDVERFRGLIETDDGGILAVGSSGSRNAGFTIKGNSDDAIVVKFDSNGVQQWVKNYGGSGQDIFNAIAPTKDGGFIAVGNSYSTDAGFDVKGTSSEGMVVKFDSNGDQQWIKGIGGSKSEELDGITVLNDNGFVIFGYTNSTDMGSDFKGGSDGFYIKLLDSYYEPLPEPTITLEEATSAVVASESQTTMETITSQAFTDALSKVNQLPESPDKTSLLNRLDTLIQNRVSKAVSEYVDNMTLTKEYVDALIEMITSLPEDSLKNSLSSQLQEVYEKVVVKAEASNSQTYVDYAKSLINALEESSTKTAWLNRLDAIIINTAPQATLIPAQEVSRGIDLKLNLSDYFKDEQNDALTYTVASTEGSTVSTEGDTLTFNSSQAGIHTVTIKANDGSLDSQEITFNVNVLAVNEPPVIKASIPEQTINEGQTLVLNALDYFEDVDTSKLEYTISTSDKVDSFAWVTTNDEIKFRSAYKGVYYVTIRATDGEGTTEPMTFKVNVKEAPKNPDTDIPVEEGNLSPVINYKEVINVSLVGMGTRKTIFVDGLLNDFDLDAITPTLKSTNGDVVNSVYDSVNKTISFESLKPGFSNIQLTINDESGNKAALLFMVDVMETANTSTEYIANGEIRLHAEAYVVELSDVYSEYSKGDVLTYNVSVNKEEETTTGDTASVTNSIKPLNVSYQPWLLKNRFIVAANRETTKYVFEVPEGVNTTTLHEDEDLFIRLVNGKMVVEGKQVGTYNVAVTATTASGTLPSTVNFQLDVLPQDDNTGDGGTTGPTPPGGGNGSDNGGNNGSNGGGSGSGNGDSGSNGNGSETTPPSGDLTDGENGDLIIEIEPGKPSISDTVDIVVDDDSITISSGEKEYDSSISNGLASYTNKRVIRNEGNGVFTTVPHFVEDNKLHIKTNNPNGLVITSRVSSNFLDTKGLFSENEVEDLFNYLIVNGTTATTYSPNADITRGQFSVMIARALELKPSGKTNKFDDASGKWYADQVQALYETGIITGFEDGTFGGEKKLSRQQAAAMIARMLEYMEVDTTPKENVALGDMDRISDYAKSAVQFLASKDVLNSGEDTNFNPYNNLTRAQMAKILMRSLQLSDWY